jgi:hypothetical protein
VCGVRDGEVRGSGAKRRHGNEIGEQGWASSIAVAMG